MSRLLDPTVCPDCRAALDAQGTCTGCGLPLRGDLAVRLWQTMQVADDLVERLRAGVAVPSVSLPGSPVAPAAPAAPPPRSPRLPARSVPVVLLSLGGLCLMVFALVFVGVAWSVLGLVGRTLVLLAVTASVAAVADLVARRGLRVSAEVLWLVAAGMLTVDVYAACSAGLLGLDALGDREVSALAGGALVALGAGVGLVAGSRHPRGDGGPAPVRRLLGMEAAVVVGALLVTVAQAWSRPDPVTGSAALVPLLALGALLLQGRLRLAAAGLGLVSVATWLLLLVELALTPTTLGSPTLDLLAGAAAVLLAAALVRLPRVRAVRAVGVFAAAGGLWAVGVLVAVPYAALGAWADTGPTTASARVAWATGGASGWALLLLVPVALVGGAELLRLLDRPVRTWLPAVPAVGALGGLALVLTLTPPVWAVVVAGLLAAGTAAAGAWWARDEAASLPAVRAAGGVAAYAALAATSVAGLSDSRLLAALDLTALAAPLLVALVLRDRDGASEPTGILAVLAAVTGGAALGAWGLQLGLEPGTRALAVAAYAGLVGLLAACTRMLAARLGLEAAAVLVGVVAVASAGDEQAAAACLTVLGTAVALLAVLRRDRQDLGWVAAAVLALATALRVLGDETAPELVTLPAAALLLVAGTLRLRREPDLASGRVLGSGLVLALVPSLLLALGDPVSVRGALLGAAAVLTLAWGVGRRLAAPFVVGAGVTAVLVLRHLGPVADAVPRWVTIGAVGVLLLVLGVTWESGLRRAARARRYLGELR